MDRHTNQPIHLSRRGPLIRATHSLTRGPEFHIADFLPVDPHPRSLPQGRPIMLPRPPHPDVIEELRLLIIEQPMSRYDPGYEYLAGDLDRGLSVPWIVERRSGLLLPAQTESERNWDEQWRIVVLVTPEAAGLPGSSADMANVAWRVLRQLDATLVARIAAALAFRLEVWGPGSRVAHSLIAEMQLPPGPRARVLAETQGGGPVFDPRCLRWIVQEVAVAKRTSGWDSSMEPPAPTDPHAVELLERVLFGGCHLGGSPPSVAEIVRAIWLLHQGFEHNSPESLSPLETVLSITGSLGTATDQDTLGLIV